MIPLYLRIVWIYEHMRGQLHCLVGNVLVRMMSPEGRRLPKMGAKTLGQCWLAPTWGYAKSTASGK